MRKQPIERICAWCERSFIPCRPVPSIKQRFCGYECAGLARRGKSIGPRGPAHHFYNGGWHFSKSNGRWYIRLRDGRMIPYYRALMEVQVGRTLGFNEIVHHINGDRTDDRLENLELMTRAEHNRLHFKKAA